MPAVGRHIRSRSRSRDVDRPLPRHHGRGTKNFVLDPRVAKCLREGIAWLNADGGFEGRLRFDEVADAASGVDEERLKHLLDELFRLGPEKIRKPSNWLWNSMANERSRQRESETHEHTKVQRAHQNASDKSAPSNIEKILRKGVAFLNMDAGFQNRISYSEVLEAASGLDEELVKDVLDQCANADPTKIRSPTMWIAKNLRNAKQSHYRRSSQAPTVESILRTGIMWLNDEGGFNDQIDFDIVLEAAEGLDEEQVKQVLDACADAEPSKIRNPSGWLASNIRNFKNRAAKPPQQPESAAGIERILRQGVQWLNTEGGFENRINFLEVVEVAAGLDEEQMKDVLDNCANVDPAKIRDPTGWLCSNIRNLVSRQSSRSSDQQSRSHSVEKPRHASRGSDQESHAHGVEKLLCEGIAFLNGEGGFEDRIIFRRVYEAAAGVSRDQVKEVLNRCFERNPRSMDEPTDWVCDALHRMKSASSSSFPRGEKPTRGSAKAGRFTQ
eukprot:TRINITY_DN26749_c0_g1_i1.p1 TRINITY_DN26749_c0_g1~~TRINITY_DN26749_c0_g1_i1.p1  ORF type:complete len:499 (-),score=61.65 TRINITY_DN26749_c0_g1_i1:50-1546(-)